MGCYDGSFLKMLPNKIKKFGLDIDKNVISKLRKNKVLIFFKILKLSNPKLNLT